MRSSLYIASTGLAAALVTACGDNIPTFPITVDTRDRETGRGGAAFVAYQEGDRWELADEGERGVFRFFVVGPLVQVAIACPSGGGVSRQGAPYRSHRVFLDYRTLDDSPEIDTWRCSEPRARINLHVSVKGTRDQELVNVNAGWGVFWERANVWSGKIPAGSVDVAAVTGTRIAIRRGVLAHQDTSISLDLDKEAADLEQRRISVEGVQGGENVLVTTTLATVGGTRVNLPDSSEGGQMYSVGVVPERLLRDGDQHHMSAYASDETASRKITMIDPKATDLSMTLPPAMGSAMVFLDGGTTLRWSAAPDGDAILTGVSQNAIDLGVSRDWTVLLWKSWLEATDIAGAGELVLPAALDVPGWDAAWGLDPALRAASSWTLGVDGETRDPSGALTSYFRTERSGRFGPQP